METVHGKSTVDVDTNSIPSTGITLEQYRALGGVPLSDSAIKSQRFHDSQNQFWKDFRIDGINMDMLDLIWSPSEIVANAKIALDEERELIKWHNAIHGENAWDLKMRHWQDIINGEAEETDEDRQDPDFNRITNSMSTPWDSSLEGHEAWLEECQRNFYLVSSRVIELKDANLESFIRNAIRDALESGIQINHRLAQNIELW